MTCVDQDMWFLLYLLGDYFVCAAESMMQLQTHLGEELSPMYLGLSTDGKSVSMARSIGLCRTRICISVSILFTRDGCG